MKRNNKLANLVINFIGGNPRVVMACYERDKEKFTKLFIDEIEGIPDARLKRGVIKIGPHYFSVRAITHFCFADPNVDVTEKPISFDEFLRNNDSLPLR